MNIEALTVAMLDRFIEGAKQCDPLTRPVSSIAGKFTNEIANVEYSLEVQRPFIKAILESKHTISELTPLLISIFEKSDMIFVAIFEAFIGRNCMRSIELLHILSPKVQTEQIWAKCLRATLLSANPIAIRKLREFPSFPQTLCQFLDPLTVGTGGVEGINDLIAKTNSIMAPPSRQDHGWELADDWRPRPFGVTKTFNASRDFKLLYGLQ